MILTIWRILNVVSTSGDQAVEKVTSTLITTLLPELVEASADGVAGFLERLREALRSGTFRPVPVRRDKRLKASGKVRKLGIPTVADRVVQASQKLVLAPIFEMDQCSTGTTSHQR